MLGSTVLCSSIDTLIFPYSTDRYGSAISQIPTAPIGFTSIVVCFLLVPGRKSHEASLRRLANLLGFYLAIWLMRFPFLSSILFS